MVVPSKGSPQSFVVDHSATYIVRFETTNEETLAQDIWYESIIGWAIVRTSEVMEGKEVDLEVEPVILYDGKPEVMTDYRLAFNRYLHWEVVVK